MIPSPIVPSIVRLQPATFQDGQLGEDKTVDLSEQAIGQRLVIGIMPVRVLV